MIGRRRVRSCVQSIIDPSSDQFSACERQNHQTRRWICEYGSFDTAVWAQLNRKHLQHVCEHNCTMQSYTPRETRKNNNNAIESVRDAVAAAIAAAHSSHSSSFQRFFDLTKLERLIAQLSTRLSPRSDILIKWTESVRRPADMTVDRTRSLTAWFMLICACPPCRCMPYFSALDFILFCRFIR